MMCSSGLSLCSVLYVLTVVNILKQRTKTINYQQPTKIIGKFEERDSFLSFSHDFLTIFVSVALQGQAVLVMKQK